MQAARIRAHIKLVREGVRELRSLPAEDAAAAT
jgi:hypothetical protein